MLGPLNRPDHMRIQYRLVACAVASAVAMVGAARGAAPAAATTAHCTSRCSCLAQGGPCWETHEDSDSVAKRALEELGPAHWRRERKTPSTSRGVPIDL